MSRRGWASVGGVAVVVAVCGGLVWFLVPKTLSDADQWASVMGPFISVPSLVVAVAALVIAARTPGGSGGAGSGRRSFRARDASGARVTLGDNSPIDD